MVETREDGGRLCMVQETIVSLPRQCNVVDTNIRNYLSLCVSSSLCQFQTFNRPLCPCDFSTVAIVVGNTQRHDLPIPQRNPYADNSFHGCSRGLKPYASNSFTLLHCVRMVGLLQGWTKVSNVLVSTVLHLPKVPKRYIHDLASMLTDLNVRMHSANNTSS